MACKTELENGDLRRMLRTFNSAVRRERILRAYKDHRVFRTKAEKAGGEAQKAEGVTVRVSV